MAVNRLLKNDAEIPDAHKKKLNDIFGESAWEQEFYKINEEKTLFGLENKTEKVVKFEGIREFLKEKLKGRACISILFRLRNKSNQNADTSSFTNFGKDI